jgi:cytochrome c oxidase subunit 2
MDKLGGVFNASSTEMEALADLTFFIITISVVIFGIIAVSITYIIIRYRSRTSEAGEPRQEFGSTKLEIVWTVIPALIVGVFFFSTIKTMYAVNPPFGEREPDIKIVGHQWWWEIYYPKSGVRTANEVHIPIGGKLLVRLESVDVIHDFWVPELAPKIDLVPGHTNHIWLSASKPGTFLGACAEFCGVQHANMRIRVIAETREDFDEWQEEQLTVPEIPTTGEAALGAKLFQEKACTNCHLTGVGPDLTHLSSRQTLAAGALANTPENLSRWLKNPEKFKPGSYMPNMKLSDTDVKAIVAYLEALK